MFNNSTLNQDDPGTAQPLSAGCFAAGAQQPRPWKAPKCTPSSDVATFASLPPFGKGAQAAEVLQWSTCSTVGRRKVYVTAEIGDPHATATPFTSHECVLTWRRRICKRLNVPQK